MEEKSCTVVCVEYYAAIKRMELWTHTATWITRALSRVKTNKKKPISKGHIPYESTYVLTLLKGQHCGDGKQISGCRGSGVRGHGGGGMTVTGTPRETFVVIRLFCILFVLVVTQAYTWDKMTQNKTHTLYWF